MSTTPAIFSTPNLPLHEIIRRAIEGNNPLALGPSYLTLSFVPDGTARDYDVDRICTVADIEAARTAIIRAVPILELVVRALAKAGNVHSRPASELTPGELCDKYDLLAPGGNWGEHPRFTMLDWRNAVANEDTRLGYWPWVENQLSFAEAEEADEGPIDEAINDPKAAPRL
jgi:hypothetical protein